LVPDADLVSPDKDHNLEAYEGWAYSARTQDKENFLLYFEKGCPTSQVRGAKLWSEYRADWFDPRNGTWQPVGKGSLRSNEIGIIVLPQFFRYRLGTAAHIHRADTGRRAKDSG
jgi:hypothetical protein